MRLDPCRFGDFRCAFTLTQHKTQRAPILHTKSDSRSLGHQPLRWSKHSAAKDEFLRGHALAREACPLGCRPGVRDGRNHVIGTPCHRIGNRGGSCVARYMYRYDAGLQIEFLGPHACQCRCQRTQISVRLAFAAPISSMTLVTLRIYQRPTYMPGWCDWNEILQRLIR